MDPVPPFIRVRLPDWLTSERDDPWSAVMLNDAEPRPVLIVKPKLLPLPGVNPPNGGKAAPAPPCPKLIPPGLNIPCGESPTDELPRPVVEPLGMLNPKLTPTFSKTPSLPD